MAFTETEIVTQLDLAYNDTPSEYYLVGRPEDVKHNWFLDLEHGYCVTAGSKIHLYADATRWAVPSDFTVKVVNKRLYGIYKDNYYYFGIKKRNPFENR